MDFGRKRNAAFEITFLIDPSSFNPTLAAWKRGAWPYVLQGGNAYYVAKMNTKKEVFQPDAFSLHHIEDHSCAKTT